MQKEYSVNLEKRDILIKQMRKKQAGVTLGLKLIQLVGWMAILFVIIKSILSLLPVVIESIGAGYIGEAVLVLVALIPVLAIVAVIWLIILFFRTHMEKKYLRPWLSYTEEHLWLHRKSMEWGHCNRFDGKYYWMLQMKYEDVQRIEYDETQHLLRVYGPYGGKKWDNCNQDRCLDSFDPYTDAKPDEHFVFCDYYNDFQQLIKDLEEVTGKTVIKKNCPMKF